MSIEPPVKPGNGQRLAVADWAFSVLRQITVQNVLTCALLVVVGAPSYFAWKFLSDENFRHEFMSTATILDMAVPCEVVQGNISGRGDRFTVTTSYAIRDRLEYLVAIRSTGLMADREVEAACRKAHEEADLMLRALRAQSTPEGAAHP